MRDIAHIPTVVSCLRLAHALNLQNAVCNRQAAQLPAATGGCVASGVGAAPLARRSPDRDADGVSDELDNCRHVFNPDQADHDADGLPDVCDPDIDNDGVPNSTDAAPFDPRRARFTVSSAADRQTALLSAERRYAVLAYRAWTARPGDLGQILAEGLLG